MQLTLMFDSGEKPTLEERITQTGVATRPVAGGWSFRSLACNVALMPFTSPGLFQSIYESASPAVFYGVKLTVARTSIDLADWHD